MLKSLKGLARIPEDAISGVLYASSLLPDKRIYEHHKFYEPSGKISGFAKIIELASFTPAPHPLSNEGLINPAVQKAWFRIACGDWTALTQVEAQSKKTGDVGAQSKLLLERADAYLAARKDAFDKRTLDFAAHREGTVLAEDMARSATHKAASKLLADQLKAAAKTDPLKSELIARSAFFALVPLQLSPKKSDVEGAKAGYVQLTKKYPDTIFGRQAKSALDSMSAVAAK